MVFLKTINLILIFIGWAGTAWAYDDANVRTQCRTRIAGHYLTKLNAKDRLAEYVSLITTKKKQFQKKLRELKQDLVKLEKEVATQEFDVALARRRDGVAFQIKTMTKQVQESSQDLIHYRSDLAQQQKQLDNLKAKIVKVFEFVKDQEVAGGGYGFRIMFRTACPKYRYICTLPAQQAIDLLDIKVDGDVPEECRRYFNLSQIEY